MAHAKTGYAEIDGGKLYYEMAGEGDTLVLVHAGFVDSRMWDDQWDAFARRYRVIRYDMSGYGKSDPAQGPVSRRDELYHLLAELQVERAALLGISLGGEAVIDLALEHPELASALIVVSATPSGFELQGEPPRYVMEMMEAAQTGELERTSELQIRIWVDGPFREPEQVNQGVRKHAAEMNRIPVKQGTFFTADAQPANPLNPPAATRLDQIRVPTLVMASGIKGAKKVIIPDSAHLPNMEKPREFNQAVFEFLEG